MERLTTIKDEKVLCNDNNPCSYICENGCVHLNKMFKKLAHYENTGLEPQQVFEIDRLYRKKCEELDRLQGFALVAENNKLRKQNASLEIKVKKLEEELKKAKESNT